jgi:hypothetical protein
MPDNYAVIPEFGQLVEYITQVVPDGNGFYDIKINSIPLEVQPILEPISIQAINIDYTKVNVINSVRVSDVTPAGLIAVKAILGTGYYDDVVKYATVASANPLIITTKLVEVFQCPSWVKGITVKVNDIYFYSVDKNLYQCVQAHTTQSDWTPPICKALWKRFYEPTGASWPWVQPIGSVDAYPIGAKVTYGGYTWQNAINANVWVPGIAGWTNLTPPPVSPNWDYPVVYKVNDLVIYIPNGFTYKCLQAHTSQAGWAPPVVPALWLKI